MADQTALIEPPVPMVPTSLPNLNTGKYAWDLVQQLLDQAAWFNIFVVPTERRARRIGSLRRISGGSVNGSLHRFKIDMATPSVQAGVKAKNILGQRSGDFRLQWFLISDDAHVMPGQVVMPPILLDPAHSQRFVMREASFIFGNGEDRFTSFGMGRIFPEFDDHQTRLRAVGIGNVTDGAGKFKDAQGTYVMAGEFTEFGEFAGSVLLRVADPNNIFHSQNALVPFVPSSEPDPRLFVPDTTYLLVRSQKSGPNQETTFNLGPLGQVRGINVPQEFRMCKVDFSTEGPGGLQSANAFGAPIGGEYSMSAIDPLHPGPPPTADSPGPFQGIGTYFFRGADGNDVARFNPQFLEGRTFPMDLTCAPGQPASRFGFLGPILNGERYFKGAEGIVLGVAGVAIMPHVFSGMQIMCLTDSDGKFRAS
jgi:hypothetical protein